MDNYCFMKPSCVDTTVTLGCTVYVILKCLNQGSLIMSQ